MRIVTITDSPSLYSGLARVHRHAIDSLVAAGHEVIPCVWFGYDTATMKKMGEGVEPPKLFYKSGDKDVRMLCVPKKNGHNCMFAIYEVLAEFKPDAVLTIGDYWDFYYMSAVKAKMDYGFKWIAYLTVEQEIGSKWKSLLEYADVLAAPSKYGCDVLDRLTGGKSSFVPYGVEKAFVRYPDDRRLALKTERGCQDKVRFICVGQNTDRKNIPALLLAVKCLASQPGGRDILDKCRFHLHSNFKLDSQVASFYDLDEMADSLGIYDYFSFASGISLFDAPDDDLLAEEYNASDFLVSTSYSEGYGLPMVEGMACGLPALANATSTSFEHLGTWPDVGLRGPVSRGYLASNDLRAFPPAVFRQEINSDSLAGAIGWAFFKKMETPRLLADMGDACTAYAREASWEGMGSSLSRLVEAACESKAPVLPLETF